jgi:hypothetical protein
MNDRLTFASDAPAEAPVTGAPWILLIVDDDPEVHAVTRLMLTHARIEGRALTLLHAHSAAEAKPMLARTPDIALALLDVVMETEHAGLDPRSTSATSSATTPSASCCAPASPARRPRTTWWRATTSTTTWPRPS